MKLTLKVNPSKTHYFLTLQIPSGSGLSSGNIELALFEGTFSLRSNGASIDHWQRSQEGLDVFHTSLAQGPFALSHLAGMLSISTHLMASRKALECKAKNSTAVAGTPVDADARWPLEIYFGALFFETLEAFIAYTRTIPDQWINLGSFNLTQPVLRVSDPCYKLDTWCAGSVKAKPGRWHARSLVGPTEWGFRTKELQVWHEGEGLSVFDSKDLFIDSAIHAGVDSGLCGFFDESSFVADVQNDVAYHAMTEVILKSPVEGMILSAQSGVVTCSGYGDGGYPCFVRRNKNDEVIAARLVYIGEETECEDDTESVEVKSA